MWQKRLPSIGWDEMSDESDNELFETVRAKPPTSRSTLQIRGEWNEASIREHVEFSKRLGEVIEIEADAEAFLDFLYKHQGVMAISPALLSQMFERKWNFCGIPVRVVREGSDDE